jgi:hypothetical protein
LKNKRSGITARVQEDPHRLYWEVVNFMKQFDVPLDQESYSVQIVKEIQKKVNKMPCGQRFRMIVVGEHGEVIFKGPQAPCPLVIQIINGHARAVKSLAAMHSVCSFCPIHQSLAAERRRLLCGLRTRDPLSSQSLASSRLPGLLQTLSPFRLRTSLLGLAGGPRVHRLPLQIPIH